MVAEGSSGWARVSRSEIGGGEPSKSATEVVFFGQRSRLLCQGRKEATLVRLGRDEDCDRCHFDTPEAVNDRFRQEANAIMSNALIDWRPSGYPSPSGYA